MAGRVRQPIDLDSLQRYIKANVPEIKTPIELKQFGFGQSNPTYQLTSPDGSKYVMRKKPPGKLLSKTAHKVDREYRIIHALENTDVPVPKTYCLCEDDSVVGTAFYIMEFLDGRIITDAWIPDVSEEHRTLMWRDAVETLAKFHRVNHRAVGLETFGKANGFYNRQIKTLTTISEAQAAAVDVETKIPVGKIEHFYDMIDYFRDPETQPKDRGTLIHGDYKIDNMVFHKTEPRVIGILDWEMATVGHPLSDLANLTSPYVSVLSPTGVGSGRGAQEFTPGTVKGLPSREQVLKWYSDAAGWDPTPEMTWGDAFGAFRSGIIMQGIAARYALRQASSEKARDYAVQMKPYSLWAWSLVQLQKGQYSKKKSAKARAWEPLPLASGREIYSAFPSSRDHQSFIIKVIHRASSNTPPIRLPASRIIHRPDQSHPPHWSSSRSRTAFLKRSLRVHRQHCCAPLSCSSTFSNPRLGRLSLSPCITLSCFSSTSISCCRSSYTTQPKQASRGSEYLPYYSKLLPPRCRVEPFVRTKTVGSTSRILVTALFKHSKERTNCAKEAVSSCTPDTFMDTYGSDDERPGSPLLVPQTINYKPADSPPPFLPAKSSSSSPESTPPPSSARSKKTVRKRRKRTQPTQGDSVLISYLDPNRPDIAREAGERALNSASQSEAGGSDDEAMGDRSNVPPNEDLCKLAQDSLHQINERLHHSDTPDPPRHEHVKGLGLAVVNGINGHHVKREPMGPVDPKDTDAAVGLQKMSESSPKDRRTPKIITSSDEKSGDELPATSPNLRKFAISASEGSPMQQLPAIQKSPPQSASASSPDGAQSLPSLKTALADAEIKDADVRQMNGSSPVARAAYPPLAGQSPPLNRVDGRQIAAHFPHHQQSSTSSPFAQLSPQSSKELQGMSPPGSTHPKLYRSSTKGDTPSTLSDHQPTPQSTEGSSAYPTPQEHGMSIDSERTLINGPHVPNGPLGSSGFKCTHPGCTAAPFQTQYLLNSHANVHSQIRPHYCPVKGCSRGVGGKGFKRKNEMIRHGLVHESPGYVCPFCPDQQHRYPRPDNLQRHVRVHHVDKEKDDPQLRQVLAQRPEGGNKGRRRRMGGP